MTGDTIYVVFHSEERGGINTEERGDMVMMVLVPTQVLTARNESSIWLLYTLSDKEVHQAYLQCV